MGSKFKREINFAVLEAELNVAAEADGRYQRENDAKFRALHQKVATYEDFRQIVLASNLKPLEKHEKIDIARSTGIWNHALSTNNSDTSVTSPDNDKAVHDHLPVPTTGPDFLKTWKRECKTFGDKYKLLVQTSSCPSTRQLVYIEICSAGLLGDILTVFCSEFQDRDLKPILSTLDHLSCVDKFKLSLAFISSSESENCSKLFNKLEQALSADDEHKQNSELVDRFRLLEGKYKLQ